ncbi:MAG: T9SS type A sorting domain-containing protein [Bacteroidota bacterium]
MKGKLSFLLAFLFFGSLQAQDITKIRDTYMMQTNASVTIQGVINCPDYGFNHGQFYVQDTTGGINIFYEFIGGEQGALVSYDEGDTIKITGTISEFASQRQILPQLGTGIEIIGAGDQLPDPIVISSEDLTVDSRFMGMRVEVANVTLTDAVQWPAGPISSSSGTNVDALAGSTNLVIRIDRGQSFFDGSSIPDEPFTIRGILGRFNNTVQILPFLESDIFQPTATSTFEALKLDSTLKVYPNPIQDQVTIEILPGAGTVNQVTLYDIMGRTMAQWNELKAKNTTLTLPVPAWLNKGNYYLSVLTENGVRTSKTVVLN